MAEIPSPPPRQFRSGASNNWRVKDNSPRTDQSQVRPRSTRNNGQPQSNSPANARPPPDAAPGTRLYVGNLLYTAQKADIETLFAERGFNVVGVTISTDPFTGRNPSYCFVDLDSAEEAQRAIAELNGADLQGRALRVNPGVARRGQGSDQGQGENGNPREVRVKNFERGWGRESREERSKLSHVLGSRTPLLKTSFQPLNTSQRSTGGTAPTHLLIGKRRKPKDDACSSATCHELSLSPHSTTKSKPYSQRTSVIRASRRQPSLSSSRRIRARSSVASPGITTIVS